MRSGLFPQLLSSVGFQRTLQTQFTGIFDGDAGRAVRRPDGQPGRADRPARRRTRALRRSARRRNPFGGGGDNDLPFGQLNTWTANLRSGSGSTTAASCAPRNARRAAGREAAALGVTTTRAQLDLDVATAFYDAALSDRLVTITEAALTQAGETLRQVELQFQVGQIAEFEVLRARVARDNQRAPSSAPASSATSPISG